MKNSIKEIIIKHLESEYGDKFCWAGVLARALHDLTGVKESAIERRARELVKSGTLEVVHEQIEGKGQKCAKYRVAEIKILIRGVIDSKTEEVIFEHPKLL